MRPSRDAVYLPEHPRFPKPAERTGVHGLVQRCLRPLLGDARSARIASACGSAERATSRRRISQAFESRRVHYW